MENKVSVLMAVYNDTEFINDAIKSILNQTYTDFEFLIIDDGSTEDIEKIVNNFKDPRIIYERINHRGLAGALNRGLELSKGDWIARIDSDDLNTVNRLSLQMAYLNENPDTDVISSWSVYFNNSKKILFELNPPEDDIKIKKLLNLHNPVNHSSVIFNKKKILDDGGYNDKFGSYEDFELWFRMREKLKFKILPEFLVYTRFRKNSLTKSASKKKIYEMLHANAASNFEVSKSGKDKKYWNTMLFWIEYFYGKKSKARIYYKDISLKKSLAYINTFLPEEEFKKLLELRIKLRLKSGLKQKGIHKEELNKMIN